MSEYAERDIEKLDEIGGHYCKHINAMTEESLHDKSEIAAELGFRDCRIAELEATIEKLCERSRNLLCAPLSFTETVIDDKGVANVKLAESAKKSIHDLVGHIRDAEKVLKGGVVK